MRRAVLLAAKSARIGWPTSDPGSVCQNACCQSQEHGCRRKRVSVWLHPRVVGLRLRRRQSTAPVACACPLLPRDPQQASTSLAVLVLQPPRPHTTTPLCTFFLCVAHPSAFVSAPHDTLPLPSPCSPNAPSVHVMQADSKTASWGLWTWAWGITSAHTRTVASASRTAQRCASTTRHTGLAATYAQSAAR